MMEADYVIIGAGAVAMAFADTLLGESDSTAIMVDRRHRPGGHWNDSYPFVRLHGPSINYGVNSRPLGEPRIDASGLNEGLFELATGSEICTYFDEVMRHQLLPTGRLTYLPMHNYKENGEAVSLLGGQTRRLHARKKIVDVSVADTQIPSRTPPSFKVADDAQLLAPNDLTRLTSVSDRFIVLGAGKTAIDTVTWLLSNGADPDAITWVRARDAWLMNRITLQPHYDFFAETFGALADAFDAVMKFDNADDIFLELERRGSMRRIDTSVTPTMFRCAIVSERELAETRRVRDVVRLGRVQAIEKGKITLAHGVREVSPDAIFVNCSACGIPRKPPQPIFQPGKIVPQYVRMCSPTFSGALAAKLELSLVNDADKNALARPVPIPNAPADWLGIQLAMGMNSASWQSNEGLMKWLSRARLDQYNAMGMRAQMETGTKNRPIMDRYRAAVRPGLERLTELIAP